MVVGVTDRTAQKAHVKLLLEAAMSEACAEHNPRLEKATATLASYRSTIEEHVMQTGGWRPGLLREIIGGRDYDDLEADIGRPFRDQIEALDKSVIACLDKDIGQQVVFDALNEWVEQQFRDIERQYGVDLRGEHDAE